MSSVFPVTAANYPADKGISLRDYIAIKYMTAKSAAGFCYSKRDLAQEAYQMADAMIEARGDKS